MIKFFRKIRQKLINENKFSLYLLYIIGEIILVVVGILVALSINNWNESKKMSLVERNILREISNGLTTDLIDIESNISGHKIGINSCVYWVKIINNKPVNIDSIQYYYHYLTRNFISVQNIAGYESLKSRGLELITNDSLRLQIISLYEEKYKNIKILEEEYSENQTYRTFFKEITNLVSSNFVFNDEGEFITATLPFNLNENDKKKLMTYLWKIRTARNFTLNEYKKVKDEAQQLKENIDLKNNQRLTL